MAIDVFIKRLQESKHLPDGLPIEEVRLSETVIVGGNWYWKSKGTCWTQPTDKSKARQEISEEEYREICAKAKSGASEESSGEKSEKEETPTKKEEPKADKKGNSKKDSMSPLDTIHQTLSGFGFEKKESTESEPHGTLVSEKPLSSEEKANVVTKMENDGWSTKKGDGITLDYVFTKGDISAEMYTYGWKTYHGDPQTRFTFTKKKSRKVEGEPKKSPEGPKELPSSVTHTMDSLKASKSSRKVFSEFSGDFGGLLDFSKVSSDTPYGSKDLVIGLDKDISREDFISAIIDSPHVEEDEDYNRESYDKEDRGSFVFKYKDFRVTVSNANTGVYRKDHPYVTFSLIK